MLSFKPCRDLQASAHITFANMQTYYAHFGVDWLVETIVEKIQPLENWDILLNGDVVGAMRMSYDDTTGLLCDLQVKSSHQNLGLGAAALAHAELLIRQRHLGGLRLRVFKISPAHRLYSRHGYSVDSDDERFYHMSKILP